MKGGESGGGLMEGRECWGWWMSSCVRGEAGTSSVVIARRLLVACRLLFACRLPVACRLLFAYRFLFACRLPIACRLACRLSSCVVVVPRCQWVVVLDVCGFSWCRAPVAIRGWWCGHVVVSWSGGEASSSSSMGGRSPFASAHASSGLVCYPTVVLGLQTRSVRWGAMKMGWPLTFPCAQVTYVAWALRSFAIVLALSSWGSKQG